MNRLEGKVAVLIGSATGIGRSIANLFALEGADLLLADYGFHSELEGVAEVARKIGRKVITSQVDVRKEDDVARTIKLAYEEFGQINVLVNNAGISAPKKPFVDSDSSFWDNIIDVNLKGVSHGMRHVLPIMIAQGFGSIINTSSQLAHKPAPESGFYCASKAAVVALSTSVAQEVASLGVRINVVCPGPTDTPMWRSGDPAWAKWKIDGLPIKRLGTPEEVAWAYVYLASDESSFMVGQSISPNGGDVMW